MAWQVCSCGLLALVKRHDARILAREARLQRLLFDTRLGMYSPR
jgi:hypothetical protein